MQFWQTSHHFTHEKYSFLESSVDLQFNTLCKSKIEQDFILKFYQNIFKVEFLDAEKYSF